MKTPTEIRFYELRLMIKRYQYRHAKSLRQRELVEQQAKLINKRISCAIRDRAKS
ncbi:conserved hypothetical protein [Vibrio chagasii]|nr:conserved hypothetical protein [Vibrio chagasii]CAH6871424.1 conserved hypothetical protein [Vibrio chagasii]CAH7134293.1 conserved hypothetical protein [Vibrio chagasii]CAH7196680.1 conserved hypothetical protein [Vibrio chagasii]CAH7239332.1 conserved hypothetical protein [Vibrio chagasii]